MLIERGRPLPDWYKDAPDMRPGDPFYLRAYDELCSERHFSDGTIGQIPWSKIVQYHQTYNLDDDLLDPLIYIIRCMEKADLDLIRQENERRRQAQERESRKGSRNKR